MNGYTASDKVLHGNINLVYIHWQDKYIGHLIKNSVGSILSAWL